MLRDKLVEIALEWQRIFGVAPSITSTVSEYDAALLVGCPEREYSKFMQSRTAVSRGYDFIHNNIRYQVKAVRPSGKPGSKITNAGKASNLDWDKLIWIRYNKYYEIEEAWLWDVQNYEKEIFPMKRVAPENIRNGKKLK